jgi:hypothetical protein
MRFCEYLTGRLLVIFWKLFYWGFSATALGLWRPIAWSALLPDLTAIDFFLCRPLKKHIYAIPSRTVEDRVSLPACSRERLAAHCRLPWNDGRRIGHLCNNEAPMVWSFDSLSHLTATSILKTVPGRMMYNNILDFLKRFSLRRACARI